MITVGIKNLRNSLSRYIDIVKTGEKILITDHNRIVAELQSSDQTKTGSSLLKKYMEEEIISGSIIKSTKKTILKKNKKASFNRQLADKIYNEARNDRI